MKLKRTLDRLPYIGIDKDGDGFLDTLPTQDTEVSIKLQEILQKIDEPSITLNNYEKITDKEKYRIWKYNDVDKRVQAVHKNIAVRKKLGDVEISTNGINGSYDYSFQLTDTYLPNLIPNSAIDQLMILPWNRNRGSIVFPYQWRLLVITNRGQIYHNFPSRAVSGDGTEVAGDIIKFEESAVWDVPGKKMPSKNINATGTETYFPGLLDTNYEYHPIPNDDPSFVNTYGNNGFGRSITKGTETFARFYEPNRHLTLEHSFGIMGTYEPDDEITMIATYKSNLGRGNRICLFATDDGGRNWYCKYEFASGDTADSFGSSINTTGIVGNYVADSFVLSRRSVTIPNATVKEPATLFVWGSDVAITSITKGNPAIVTTSAPHSLGTNNVIVIKDNSANANISADWDWLRNDAVNANSGGNGKMFKAKKLSATTFELHEYIHSPFNNITCRHIHHINRVKDGWVMGTGEYYPDGWMIYFQMKHETPFSGQYAYAPLPAVRLNSTSNSTQRTLGALLLDNANQDFIVASDTGILHRTPLTLPVGRTDEIVRSSAGVFRGKLADVDDFDSKFECIFETRETAYFFKEKQGVWIFIGRLGEVGLSFDRGVSWHREEIHKTAELFYGESENFVVVQDFIFEFK